MKSMKRVIRSAGVAILALALTITAVIGTEEGVPDREHNVTKPEKNGVAGVAAAMGEYELDLAKELKLSVSVERASVNVVTAAMQQEDQPQQASAEKKSDKKAEVKKASAQKVADKNTPAQKAAAEEASAEMVASEKASVEMVTAGDTHSAEDEEWEDKLMADVDDFLYVRAEADKDSRIVGKMYKGHRALIRKKGKTWTLIESGNVKGYVKNEYCVFGSEALAYAKENCETIVKVETDGLRIRSEANEDARIIQAVGKGDSLVVDTDAKEVDGWIAVEVDDQTCYVSSDYVTVRLDTGKAITIEEEMAAIQAAKEAEAAAAAAKAASVSRKSSSGSASRGQTTETNSSSGASLAATADEETLLAALVECEAGGCGVECMTAVGAVVINRVRSGSFPNSIYSVIYQRGQFGPASSGRLERKLANGVSSSARRAARAALSGSDPTGGAKYFKLASSGHAGVVIGPVVFY